MITQDQSEVVAFLASSAAHVGAAVERIETHASIVFVVGKRALKMKTGRPIRLSGFFDYGAATGHVRGEVRINRRTAPELYRGVVAVTRESNGALACSGYTFELRRLVLRCSR
jgi:uncharacterized protein